MSPLSSKVFKTGLFSPISLERGEFILKGTEFILNINALGPQWRVKTIVSVVQSCRSLTGTVSPVTDNHKEIFYKQVSSDYILDNCPKEIAGKLLFHLDFLF
jgi:hypothetical protein